MTADKKIKEMIAQMILKDNYWGYLFSRIRRVEIENLDSIMGVYTDGDGIVHLGYHPELVLHTEETHLKKIVEHEGMHLLNKHIQRFLQIISIERNQNMKYVKSKVWNQAADCAANEQAEIKDMIEIAGKKISPLLPKMFDLKAPNITEYYFYELMKRVKINKVKFPSNGGDGEGEQGIQGQCQGQGDQDDGLGGKGFDSHDGWGKGNAGSDPNIVARKVDEYLREIIRDSIKNFSTKRGTLPSGLQELIDKFMKPTEIPYYQMLRKLVIGSRLSKFSKCYTRINRKRTYLCATEDDYIPLIPPFPGRKSDFSFDVNILIDTSGSMSCKDIQEGLKSIKDLIENDRNCRVHVIENDACIQKEYDVKRIRDIQFEVKGRGGTTLLPGIDRCRELKADVTLAFTDGYCENLNQVNIKRFPKKLIWVITENGTDDSVNRTGRVLFLKK